MHGLPIKAEISPGQRSDYTGYDLLQDEDLPDPKVFIADRGYDANAIREGVEGKGGIAIIPRRSNRKKQPFLDPFVYALRNQIERCFNNLKNARRLATRYDKTANSYLDFIHIVSARLWIKKFINRT
ncbi:Transposase [Cohaesibacter sp. ES.047]|nr:Transposase [Cohaesibacter sp. ES.047]